MPPVRTVAAAKPVKTERTHEENQERAYIAASRRSDRSLEARIESARRASEIHKKRTGRALRVTEQDVVNEEMYEEEDDDLPAQYRRLTAHLQTNSVDFNRRLHAYLASQHATRAALAAQCGYPISNSYMQPFPDATQFPHQMMQPVTPSQMLPPQMFHQSPQSYRHTPYPMASAQGYRPQSHQRSTSIPTSQDVPSFQPNLPVSSGPEMSRSSEQRRMSLPPQAPQPQSQSPVNTQTRPSISRSSTSVHIPNQDSSQHTFSNHESNSPSYASTQIPQTQAQQHTQSAYSFMTHMHMGLDATSQNFSMSPFSTSLPAESQLFLGPALDPNDPHTPMFMAGSEIMPQPFYSYNPNLSSKSRLAHSTDFSINQTLAPSAPIQVDTTADSMTSSNPPSATTGTPDGLITPFTPSFGYGFDPTFGDPFKSVSLTRNNSAQGSPDGMTPGDWSNLIDGSMWEAPASG
ncbi:hypothetical protein AOQ84DRAFT_171432 [Glonium stellatum]|uniref:Uncharacterized protein n=1 Tax=Glonium stellatum TaxID=574774 RepID=A0A8E2F7E8_9PEZI|nr:hypothetical protein AOQ84DRAFT_171432 [Glonium stellatum]